jgi:hypothetical protein
MTSAVYLTLGVLVLGLAVQIFRNKPERKKKFWVCSFFWVSVAAVFIYYILFTVLQYFIWKNGGKPFIYFLPPHESIFYLLNYHFIRFLLYYLISFGAAFLFLYFTKRYNRKMGFKFFEDEEPYFGALSVFLLGNPSWPWLWIYYLGAVLFLSFIFSFFRNYFLKKKERFPLYHLWFPVAILVIIINVIF